MNLRTDFVWIDEDVVLAIHEAQVAEHGGGVGIRDGGLLSSALARPQHAAAYADRPDVTELAALYALGIIKNHPFVDGNKRVGAVLLETFLELHGYELAATDAELLSAILGIASGEMPESEFIMWLRRCAQKAPK